MDDDLLRKNCSALIAATWVTVYMAIFSGVSNHGIAILADLANHAGNASDGGFAVLTSP
jgi:hypothetical protein